MVVLVLVMSPKLRQKVTKEHIPERAHHFYTDFQLKIVLCSPSFNPLNLKKFIAYTIQFGKRLAKLSKHFVKLLQSDLKFLEVAQHTKKLILFFKLI